MDSLRRQSCGHLTNISVSVVSEDKSISFICEECFQDILPKLKERRLNSTPLDPELDCLVCNKKGARLNIDLHCGICDRCLKNSQELQDKAQFSFKPREQPCDMILPNLFIGPKESAINPTSLKENSITRILTCCSSIPLYLKDHDGLRYHRLPMADSLDQNLIEYLPQALTFIEEGLANNEGVLVHCNAGVSRSGSIIVAYLMKLNSWTFEEALYFAKEKRSIITPNSNFIKQLKAM